MSVLRDLGSYGVLLIATCFFVEGLLRLPLLQRVRKMQYTLGRVRFVLGARFVSDHWKEQSLLAYAGKLWVDSAMLLVLLLLLGGPLWLLLHLLARAGIFNLEVLSSLSGMVLATLMGTVYALLRSRSRERADG